MIFKKKERIIGNELDLPKGKRSIGMNMDAELKLLRWMATNSTGSLSREIIYQYGDNLANVTGLLKDGLILEEKTMMSPTEERIYYRISPSGYRFVKEEDVRNRNKLILEVSLVTLVLSTIGLLLRFFGI